MNEIKITDINGIHIGQVENAEGGTGCTVIVCPEGMSAGVDVRGGGPASRETELLNGRANADKIHALVLGGGSAFGLDAAGGVMKCLEEKGIGYDVGVTRVPLVCQSDIFDLTVADVFARPDTAMGYEAARMALENENYQDGNFGAGCGATVGKICGMERCMKTGIGSYALQEGELIVGAVVVVNAFGDVYDHETGQKIAGVLNENLDGFDDAEKILLQKIGEVRDKFTGNTTIGAIITNAGFDKVKLGKIAAMGQNGLARTIRPVHSTADGDTVYALSVGELEADIDAIGTLATEVMCRAIRNAVNHADSAYGYPSAGDL